MMVVVVVVGEERVVEVVAAPRSMWRRWRGCGLGRWWRA